MPAAAVLRSRVIYFSAIEGLTAVRTLRIGRSGTGWKSNDPMPPSPGVRPDLATRLRQSQRALESRLGKPDTHLSLMRAAHESLDPERDWRAGRRRRPSSGSRPRHARCWRPTTTARSCRSRGRGLSRRLSAAAHGRRAAGCSRTAVSLRPPICARDARVTGRVRGGAGACRCACAGADHRRAGRVSIGTRVTSGADAAAVA